MTETKNPVYGVDEQIKALSKIFWFKQLLFKHLWVRGDSVK